MAGKQTFSLISGIIITLTGLFSYYEHLTREARKNENSRLVSYIDLMVSACPDVSQDGINHVRSICLAARDNQRACPRNYLNILKRYQEVATRADTSDRCKITVENFSQTALRDLAKAFDKRMHGELQSALPELSGQRARQARQLQNALGTPLVDCENSATGACAMPSQSAEPEGEQ